MKNEMKNITTVEDYAVQKSAINIARLGIKAWDTEKKKGLSKPLFISPENVFAEQYGAHPQELKKIIQESRLKMAEMLTSPQIEGKANPYYNKKVSKDEAKKIAEAVKELGLKYVVVTSVTRDDLEDGGARAFIETIREIRKASTAKVEILTPDFNLNMASLRKLIDADPDVFSHNIETVERLFPKIRPQADFKRSIIFLKRIKELNPKQITKSGLMIGLGETKDEIIKTMRTLRLVKVDILTIGQYLQPRKDLAEVQKYYTPEEFKEFQALGYEMGFKFVKSAPLVRSSYMAEEALKCGDL